MSVNGAYERVSEEEGAVPIAITSGSSRDHREDLTQWMRALVTTHDGDVPRFMRPFDGKRSDNVSLSVVVHEVIEQLRASEAATPEEPIVVFDSGGSSQENMKASNEAKIRWCRRVPETSREAKAALALQPELWQELSDQSGSCVRVQQTLPQGEERWLMIRPTKNWEAARQRVRKHANNNDDVWEKRLWHLSPQSCACEVDAQETFQKTMSKLPASVQATASFRGEPQEKKAGRPSAEATPARMIWKVVPRVAIRWDIVEHAADQQARVLIARNVRDAESLSDEALFATDKEQGSVERGCRFLNDPLLLASSVCVKKPSRLIALRCILVLCLRVSRLAERRLRQRVQECEHTIPNQINKPTARPTMRWVFHCFEGIELLPIRVGSTFTTRIVRLQPLHQHILRLLGPPSQHFSFFSDEKLRNVGFPMTSFACWCKSYSPEEARRAIL